MTIKNYTAIQTNNENLFKVVDLNGDWTHYYHKELGYLPSATRIISIGFPKGEGLLRWLKSMSAEEGEKAMKQAGKRGSKVHNAIADLINGQEVILSNKYPNENKIPETSGRRFLSPSYQSRNSDFFRHSSFRRDSRLCRRTYYTERAKNQHQRK